MEEPKLPTAENVTAINKEYLEKAAVEKRKNLLLNYITNEKEKEINLKKNSANSYLIINKINELADWFVKSITEDMDFILDCLTNVQDDLPKGSTLDDQLKNAQEIVDEAAKNWIEDWRDAITELKDNVSFSFRIGGIYYNGCHKLMKLKNLSVCKSVGIKSSSFSLYLSECSKSSNLIGTWNCWKH